MTLSTKYITALVLMGAFFLSALPAFAESGSSDNGAVSSTVLSCLKTAVGVRETTLKSGWADFSDAVGDAYSDRADALAAAYGSGQTRAEVKADVKAAWKAFKSAVKEARGDWKSTRNGAWKTFRTSLKACKSSDLGDTSSSALEVSGD